MGMRVDSFPKFLRTFKTIKPLSNFDIMEKCNSLKIKHFKGVLMRDELKGKASKNESIILNMDDSSGSGLHWVCLHVRQGKCFYFDSFSFPPPLEVLQYCSDIDQDCRFYNTFRIQQPHEVICGHYSIYVIYQLNKGMLYSDILNELYQRNNS